MYIILYYSRSWSDEHFWKFTCQMWLVYHVRALNPYTGVINPLISSYFFSILPICCWVWSQQTNKNNADARILYSTVFKLKAASFVNTCTRISVEICDLLQSQNFLHCFSSEGDGFLILHSSERTEYLYFSSYKKVHRKFVYCRVVYFRKFM